MDSKGKILKVSDIKTNKLLIWFSNFIYKINICDNKLNDF